LNRLVVEQLSKDSGNTQPVIIARCPPVAPSASSPPGPWLDASTGVQMEPDLPVHASWQAANYYPQVVATMRVQQLTDRAQARQSFAYLLAVLDGSP